MALQGLPFTQAHYGQIIADLEQQNLYDPTTNAVIAQVPTTVGAYQTLYNFVFSLINAGQPAVDSSTNYWFKQAGNINGDVSAAPANGFVRGVTQYGLEFQGELEGLSQTEINQSIQLTSNTIGENVFDSILETGGIVDFPDFISSDVSPAIFAQTPNTHPQLMGGWGGSFYYWNTPLNSLNGTTISLGNVVLSGGTIVGQGGVAKTQAASLSEFIWANGHCVADFGVAELELEGLVNTSNPFLSSLMDFANSNVNPEAAVQNALTSITAGYAAQCPLKYKVEIGALAAAMIGAEWATGTLSTGPHPVTAPITSAVTPIGTQVTEVLGDGVTLTEIVGNAGDTGVYWTSSVGTGSDQVFANGAMEFQEQSGGGVLQTGLLEPDGSVAVVEGGIGLNIGQSSTDQTTLIGGLGSDTFALGPLMESVADVIDDGQGSGLGTISVGSSTQWQGLGNRSRFGSRYKGFKDSSSAAGSLCARGSFLKPSMMSPLSSEATSKCTG